MGMLLGFGALCGCGAYLLCLALGAAILRGAVALANRIVGPVKTDTFGNWDDWDSDDEPAYVRSRRRGGKRAIPEPGIGKCILMLFATSLISLVVTYVLAYFAQELLDLRMRGEESQIAAAVISLPVTFAALTLVLVALLPTTFWRAAMVGFLYYLIILVLAAIIGGSVYAIFALTAF